VHLDIQQEWAFEVLRWSSRINHLESHNLDTVITRRCIREMSVSGASLGAMSGQGFAQALDDGIQGAEFGAIAGGITFREDRRGVMFHGRSYHISNV
jgi:hypothetical protein